ncbi:uncharacterized protein LOC124310671 isoform X2 [Daphnia pulicaria]|uniref:uncharacterized protein LOC124310671 isoform X2 n=1 Tax=Daphnia pulicaria TaxID=35523 RepID=UPI001EEBC258|nr:uncharacterized protein LOC124310671 isoform X2 [Daphnia pulicaria]
MKHHDHMIAIYKEVDVIQHVCDRSLHTGDVKDCALYGKGSGWKTDNAFRLVQQLILDNVLEERLVCEKGRQAYAIILIGSNWPLQKNNQPRVEIRRKKRRNRIRSSSPETREQSPSIPDCSDVPMELVIAIVADANDNSSDSSEEEISTEEMEEHGKCICSNCHMRHSWLVFFCAISETAKENELSAPSGPPVRLVTVGEEMQVVPGSRTCYHCRVVGHIAKDCTNPTYRARQTSCAPYGALCGRHGTATIRSHGMARHHHPQSAGIWYPL